MMLLQGESMTHPVNVVHTRYFLYEIGNLLTNDTHTIEFRERKCRSRVEISDILNFLPEIRNLHYNLP